MEKNYCQSCGMLLDTPELLGTNQDGTPTHEFCSYCYKDGAYTMPDCSMDEMIEHCLFYLDEFNSESSTEFSREQAYAEMKKYFPLLKRWAQK